MFIDIGKYCDIFVHTFFSEYMQKLANRESTFYLNETSRLVSLICRLVGVPIKSISGNTTLEGLKKKKNLRRTPQKMVAQIP